MTGTPQRSLRLGIIGTGAIGEAFIRGLSQQATFIIYDKLKEKAAALAQATGARCVDSLQALADEKPDWTVLAVKPSDAEAVAHQVKLHQGQRLVSCLAGVTVSKLAALFPQATVARLMPNLMIQVGAGAMALVPQATMSAQDVTQLQSWLAPLGRVFLVDEPHLEKLTALTGSGPAFMFLVAEAFMDGAIAIGIPAHQARDYVAQLLVGVGAALEHHHPAQWRQSICSPAGTTIAGVRRLEADGVRSGLIEAIVAAYERGQELKS